MGALGIEVCGFVWVCLDRIRHSCDLDPEHRVRHRCHCGEVLPAWRAEQLAREAAE